MNLRLDVLLEESVVALTGWLGFTNESTIRPGGTGGWGPGLPK